MQPIDLLRNATVDDGLDIVLKAFRTWFNYVINPQSTHVREDLRQYAAKVLPTRRRKLKLETLQDYAMFLMGEFYLRFSNKHIKEKRQRNPVEPTALSKAEIESRAQALADLMKDLSVEQALNQWESTVSEWAATININHLRAEIREFQKARDPKMKDSDRRSYKNLTDEECSEHIFYHLALATEY